MKHLLFLIALLTIQTLSAQDQMFDICPLKVGQAVPNTTLTDQDNKQVTLSDLTADKPTVLLFYRGAWCGYCTKHLAELNDNKAAIEKLGYQVIGITVDKAEKLAESIEDREDEITVYSDAKLETILAFGLNWKADNTLYNKYKNDYKLDLEEWSGQDHHSLPVPAIFIIKDGTVEFQYVNPNYRKRLKPEILLAILETL